MAAPGKKSDGFYFQAATFYYNHGNDLNKALDWVNAALADKPQIAFEILHLKAQILAKQGDKVGAIAAAKESSELSIVRRGRKQFVRENESDPFRVCANDPTPATTFAGKPDLRHGRFQSSIRGAVGNKFRGGNSTATEKFPRDG